MAVCSVADCGRVTTARGYCVKHYQNILRHGSPFPVHPEYSNRQALPGDRLREESTRLDDCWIWPYGRQKNGYARINVGPTRKLAHRAAYELFVGPIPDGYTIDHLCHNESVCDEGFDCKHRACVNPEHLEAVPMNVNLRRSPNRPESRTHCPQGHPYEGENLVYEKGRYGVVRKCRICRAASARRAGARRRARQREG